MMKNDDVYIKTLLENLDDGVYFVDRERKINYWSKGAERITGYTASEVIGRRCNEDIFLHVDKDGNILCTEICPLADTVRDGVERKTEVYMHHRDGHRVQVKVHVAPIRENGGSIAGGVEIFTDNTPLAQSLERLAELERLAFLDPLTGLANRRYAEITLRARIEELQRYNWRFGILFADIDHFKKVNDQYGHDRGDEVLKMVAKTLQNSMRSFDIMSRWGGEEYVAVIANVEGEELVATANRCRTLIERSSLPSIPDFVVTISIGATLAQPGDTIESLVKRADMLMYRSKQAGRNQVTVE